MYLATYLGQKEVLLMMGFTVVESRDEWVG